MTRFTDSRLKIVEVYIKIREALRGVSNPLHSSQLKVIYKYWQFSLAMHSITTPYQLLRLRNIKIKLSL
jgi:hypothetical protein